MINRTRYKTVRAYLDLVDAAGREEKIENQILIDVTIDVQTFLPDPRLPHFGIFGPPVGENCYPFVLRNEQMDFGQGLHAQWRFCDLNICKRRVEVGQLVTYTGEFGEKIYRVREVS